MDTGKKAAIGASIVLVAAVGIRVGMIYRERNAPAAPVKAEREKIADDDLVFLKHKRPSSMEDIKDLYGRPLWVSAASQIDYYPYSGHHVDYGHTAGTLLGAQKLMVKDAVEQVAPKAATYRIPGGDRQVLLVFTLPDSGDAAKLYAAPVGYYQDKQYTFYTDEVFFYDDPHQLYAHWGPQVWEAIDHHQVLVGMSEREVQLSLGQVFKSLSNDYGNRLVVYSNLGHPMAVTFVKDKVTSFRPDA